ncbi:AAA family ATPase [Paenibacillus roseipurpureus]|uniref:AAA family ATPase n=1 Tax=Paenibacillus roseopurpureus TaxID=2918901 RepID=A0AA96RJU4_9BACL|nr:AAA family ATPase [Paenibacillus sp. MBLB1832]WNR44150.1 AAA family ATPase [Paenibacillus sp. MBLB1832]
MRKLLFFIGPAGAGKTTLAKTWVRQHGGAFLDMDTLLRPAAEAIMTLAGQDPSDRDSPFYKAHCRDLGYRITMDAALEQLAVNQDAIVIGPFTKEQGDPLWLEAELARIGATVDDVCVRVIYVYLPSEAAYQERIRLRGSALDVWKLDNWDQFRPSLQRREVTWRMPACALLYWDNSEPLTDERWAELERMIGL